MCALRSKGAHNTNGSLSNDFLPLDSFANVRRSIADVADESNLQFTVTVSRKPQRERVKWSIKITRTFNYRQRNAILQDITHRGWEITLRSAR